MIWEEGLRLQNKHTCNITVLPTNRDILHGYDTEYVFMKSPSVTDSYIKLMHD